uniref:Kinesin-like protein n=1 Tax=Cacopsylla melanoneura TaxID=428564 RepID=A0A8D8SI95_9HEMI
MAAENVKVIVRCRPMNGRENGLKCKGIVFMDSEKCCCSIMHPNDSSAPPKGFTFDGVYDANSTTEQIYNEIAYPLIEGVLEGYNSTVFAYGQTGCGKSFSMQGVLEPPSQRGIIPRAFEHIFESISLAEETKYLILASYLEIYNEEIRDLLSAEVRRKLDLKESPDKGVYVTDLSHHAVQTVTDCQRLMEQGWNNRSVGSTLMNADSSRSHSIFCISVENMNIASSDGCEMEGDGPIRRGKLNLVDLAGSERQAKTGATGDRLKEATKINLSLSALGNVISALVDGKAKHIPYRDSKLTRLLQDSLGGNTKTLMVACLSPADNNYDETLSTLRYANRAKNIANKPKINEDPKDTMLREYQEEIRQLRALLESSGTMPPDGDTCLFSAKGIKGTPQERENLRHEYESEMEKLREQYNAERKSKSKMEADLEALKEQYQRDMENIGNNNSLSSPAVVLTTTDSDKDFAVKKCPDASAAQQEILKRLQNLQASMVGGERKNDRELKEKKLKKKLAVEKRLKSLAQVLAKVDDSDDGGSSLLLGVYDDIQDELKNKIEQLKKQKQKVKALDREIQDLQSEFELERTDYLETIRKHTRQNQLNNQIFEKIVPIINKDCNYSNIERIKQEAVWSEETLSWRLPELVTLHSKLPPAGSHAAYISASLDLLTQSQRWKNNMSGSSNHSLSTSNSTSLSNSSPESCTSRRGSSDLKFHKDEDIAENYFKPKRATELLRQDEAGTALTRWKDLTAKSNKLNPLQANPNSLPSSFSPLRSSGRSHSVWQSSPNVTNHWINSPVAPSPDLSLRKPMRLDALPDLKVSDKRRKGSLNLNKMDVLSTQSILH